MRGTAYVSPIGGPYCSSGAPNWQQYCDKAPGTQMMLAAGIPVSSASDHVMQRLDSHQGHMWGTWLD